MVDGGSCVAHVTAMMNSFCIPSLAHSQMNMAFFMRVTRGEDVFINREQLVNEEIGSNKVHIKERSEKYGYFETKIMDVIKTGKAIRQPPGLPNLYIPFLLDVAAVSAPSHEATGPEGAPARETVLAT